MALEGVEALGPVMQQHIQQVRRYFRDFRELNLLVKGEESSDRQIAWATYDFLSDFAAAPPDLGYYDINFFYYKHWHSFAVRGTAIPLFQSLINFYTRNALSYSDGGISIGLGDRSQGYQQILHPLNTWYIQTRESMKAAMNIAQLLSPDSTGLFSDYAMLANSYIF